MAVELVLEIEHGFGQPVGIDRLRTLRPPVLAYLVVLAINAAHIAVAEEDGPRPPAAGNNRFFTVVGAYRGDDGQTTGMTKAGLVIKSVDTAQVRADITGTESGFQFFGAARQLSRPVKGQVAGGDRRSGD